MKYITTYGEAFIELFLEMAPFLLLGFLIAGVLHIFFPKSLIEKYVGRNNTKSVIFAALLGVPLPLCSCGVIPTGVSLQKHGASKGATVSFLISTPQTGIDSMMITYSMLGGVFAFLRPIIALITGIVGGILVNIFGEKEIVQDVKTCEDDCETEHEERNKFSKWEKMFHYGFIDLLDDIVKWLLIGLLLATLITVLLPSDFFTNHLENQYLSMLAILLVSIPLYVCATGSVPIAFAFLMKGLSPGAALIFLMAGPATNASTITVLSKTLGKKTTMIYVGTIIVGSIFSGLLINWFIPSSWFVFSGEHSHIHGFEWWHYVSGILLAILMLYSISKKVIQKYQKQEIKMNKQTIAVEGMTCNHCKNNVEKNLAIIEGVTSVEVNLSQETVNIEGVFSIDEIVDKINQLGYQCKR